MGKPMNWKEIVINTLYLRDRGTCSLCMREITQSDMCEIDYVTEKANGGLDVIDNLRLVHLECHKTRDQINISSISPDIIKKVSILVPAGLSLHDTQNVMVLQSMAACKGNQTEAAKMLGVTRAKFRILLKHLKYERGTVHFEK